jgi:hypothetical protein
MIPMTRSPITPPGPSPGTTFLASHPAMIPTIIHEKILISLTPPSELTDPWLLPVYRKTLTHYSGWIQGENLAPTPLGAGTRARMPSLGQISLSSHVPVSPAGLRGCVVRSIAVRRSSRRANDLRVACGARFYPSPLPSSGSLGGHRTGFAERCSSLHNCRMVIMPRLPFGNPRRTGGRIQSRSRYSVQPP